MDNAPRPIELGRQFAAALDARDYARAAEFIAANCRYVRAHQKVLMGPAAILESYHERDAKARRDFDSVAYRSEATVDESGGVRLTFFDELHCDGATHTFRCSQIVYFNENQKVERIELAELPDERDKLKEFCASHGIQRH